MYCEVYTHAVAVTVVCCSIYSSLMHILYSILF